MYKEKQISFRSLKKQQQILLGSGNLQKIVGFIQKENRSSMCTRYGENMVGNEPIYN